MSEAKPTIESVRAKLSAARGPAFWRSLDEVADTEAFRSFVEAEFPSAVEAVAAPSLDRRRFLKLMGASLALGGLGACTRQPTEHILPYTKQPENVVPGEPLYYATTMELGGFGVGVLAESHMGRPTKIEGNPDHPASGGASDAFAQASVLELYDPDRAQVITRAGEIRTWKEFGDTALSFLTERSGDGGGRLRLLTQSVTSPTLAHWIGELREQYPAAKWHQWEPLTRDHARRGAELAFGKAVSTVGDFAKADVIVSIDADFLGTGPGSLRATREFSAKRRVAGTDSSMNRLYMVESGVSITGGMADHRLPLRPSAVADFAYALAAALGIDTDAPTRLAEHHDWIEAAAKDLRSAGHNAMVVVGSEQAPDVHAVVHAINDRLGAFGHTLRAIAPVEVEATDQLASLSELTEDMAAGKVDAVLILGGNPVYDAPADLDFASALAKVPVSVHLSLYANETSRISLWHVPETHYLETWGDLRATDGTASVVQPLIAPLYDGKSAVEMVAAIAGRATASTHELVREYWQTTFGESDFERRWNRAIHDGVLAGTAAAQLTGLKAKAPAAQPQAETGATIEIAFRADPSTYDGRFANNAWLQELPRPLTKLVWDNAALVAPSTAEKLGVENGGVLAIERDGRKLTAPAWITPGIAADTVVLPLGYGRTRAGSVGNEVGVDAYRLRTRNALWLVADATVTKTGGIRELVSTQDHHSMEGRALVRRATLDHYRKDEQFAHRSDHGIDLDATMFPDHPYEGHAWGLTIDLAACTGCNACTVACQAENNIAVVGKTEVSRGREMHWIRVDRYYEGELDEPVAHHQPVPCMHCEKAPCEVVCPVNATVHSDEGLNDMVYNRCVGTRYCANNCPYKVRRFNFFLYSDFETETLKMQRNPDVTIRSRGVMEKCTYCVQRVNYARIRARRDGRDLADGEIETACQQACPAGAIVFGDLNDEGSRIAANKADARNYSLLEELGTKPRTTYMAKVTNPNPALVPPTEVPDHRPSGHHGGGHGDDHDPHGSGGHG